MLLWYVADLYRSAEAGVGGPENALPPRLFFVTLTFLIAAILIVVSVETSNNSLPNFRFDPVAARKSTAKVSARIGHDAWVVPRAVGRATLAVPRTILHGAGFAVSMLNVPKFIKPAATVKAPAITTLPADLADAIRQAPAPAPVQPYTAGTASVATHAAPVTTRSGNTYEWGNCTWWVAILRARNNDPIPNSWGNARTWASRAARDGYVVDHTPSPGAILQASTRGWGHVAFVESVDADGTWHISEMNVLGLDVVDHKAMPLSAATGYDFIHDPS
jgi:surface antigen